MSGLCGWFTPPDAIAIDPHAIGPMTRALARFDGAEVRVASGAFGGVGVARGRGDDADLFEGDGQMVALWGRAALNGAGATGGGERLGAAAIAEQFARRGPSLFGLLTGSFAIAILDARRGEALLAVDRMGTRPLGYRLQGTALIFGSRFDVLGMAADAAPGVSSQAIYDYVYHHMVPAPESIHPGARRLQPGEYVRLHEGRLTTALHWQIRFVEDDIRAVAQGKDEFLGVVKDSVRRSATGGAATAASGKTI